MPKNDPVNHPLHYCRNGVEVIDLIDGLSFCRGAAIKYLFRAGYKDPDKELEDLQKAAWNVQREIERYKREHPKQVEKPEVSVRPMGVGRGLLAHIQRRKDR
jgi:hypothetical protein